MPRFEWVAYGYVALVGALFVIFEAISFEVAVVLLLQWLAADTVVRRWSR